ncbi:MAG: NUDIX hydrolase [Rhizobiales bacterium]|nr:NUDIX hydrolase [Hyphomicrobiales bacterium]
MAARRKKQVAALCWRRRKGKVEVLLVTSRETKRWVTPKGWPLPGLQDVTAARREAFEEAGVEGHVRKRSIGHYDYGKRLAGGEVQPCRVTVFGLEVTQEKKSWPEKRQRKRKWFVAEAAAKKVDEAGLKQIISYFAS